MFLADACQQSSSGAVKKNNNIKAVFAERHHWRWAKFTKVSELPQMENWQLAKCCEKDGLTVR